MSAIRLCLSKYLGPLLLDYCSRHGMRNSEGAVQVSNKSARRRDSMAENRRRFRHPLFRQAPDHHQTASLDSSHTEAPRTP